MNYRVVSYFLSIVCFFVAAAMSFCCLFAFPWLGHRSNEDYSTLSFEADGVRGLLCSVVVSLIAGLLLRHWAKGEKKDGLYRKEAMATVGLSWVIVTVLGGLPYISQVKNMLLPSDLKANSMLKSMNTITIGDKIGSPTTRISVTTSISF